MKITRLDKLTGTSDSELFSSYFLCNEEEYLYVGCTNGAIYLYDLQRRLLFKSSRPEDVTLEAPHKYTQFTFRSQLLLNSPFRSHPLLFSL